MSGVEGFMYPNEVALQWSVLIVLYPFITGLVAGAFILASLERVFQVEAVKPTYRLALLTALAFLLVAPLPLQLHLGHPERSPEMYFTPHSSSAMAMFGYVYLWYLMAVLVFEIWLAGHRRTGGLDRHANRHPFRFSIARICRLHLWLDQGKSLVVVAADAGGLHLFGHGVGDCRGDAAVHGADPAAQAEDRHALRCTCSTSSSSTSVWRCWT